MVEVWEVVSVASKRFLKQKGDTITKGIQGKGVGGIMQVSWKLCSKTQYEFKFFANGHPSLLCSKHFFSSYLQMGTHLSFLFMNFFSQVIYKWVAIYLFLFTNSSSQVLYKWVPMSSLLKSSSFQILCKLIPMFYFFKIFARLQIVDPTFDIGSLLKPWIQTQIKWKKTIICMYN